MPPIQIRDAETGSSARVAADLGFNCFEFHANVEGALVDVIEAPADFAAGGHRPSSYGIPLLFPFPNRIRGGRFSWEGKQYHLPDSQVAYDRTGNAIHGFCLDRPWRVIDQGDDFVTGEFQLSVDAPERLELWPADFIIRVRYAVKSATLSTLIEIENPADAPLPWGFGTHAYFRVPLSDDSKPEDCLIEAPLGESWELIDCLPTGERRPFPDDKDLSEGVHFGSVTLDDAFTIAPEGDVIETVIYDGPAGLQLTQYFGREYRELVVYTPPDRNSVCMEPYTCVTDAINLTQQGVDAGWRTLAPRGKFQSQIHIQAGLILV